MMHTTNWGHKGLTVLISIIFLGFTGISAPGPATSGVSGVSSKTELVRASECYRYGDDETPAQAKRKAVILAQERAVRSHHVFIQSSSKIKNFQMEEDLIQNVSAGILEAVKIDQEETKAQEVCVSITAQLSPVSMEELIHQRLNAKEQVEAMQQPVATAGPSSGLRMWTHYDEQKRDRRFLEGESLTIYVQSDRDGFLKLDYCGADGKMIHMVPNKYRGQAYIKAGQKYLFGGGGLERFEVNPPFGDEAVKAIVSSTPIVADELSRDEEETCKDYLVRLYPHARSLKVRPVETTLTLMTESRQVSDYRRERAKPQLK